MNKILEWFNRKKEMRYIDLALLLWIFLFMLSHIYYPFNKWILIAYLFGIGNMLIIKSIVKKESYLEVISLAFILAILTLIIEIIGKIG